MGWRVAISPLQCICPILIYPFLIPGKQGAEEIKIVACQAIGVAFIGMAYCIGDSMSSGRSLCDFLGISQIYGSTGRCRSTARRRDIFRFPKFLKPVSPEGSVAIINIGIAHEIHILVVGHPAYQQPVDRQVPSVWVVPE